VDYRAETWVFMQGRCALFDRQSCRSILSSASEIDGYPVLRVGGGGGTRQVLLCGTGREHRHAALSKDASMLPLRNGASCASIAPFFWAIFRFPFSACRVRLVEEQNARNAVEVGVGGLPATVLLRYCYLPADWLITLRAAASALSFTDEKPRATGTLQRALSRVVSGKGTQDQPTPGSDVSGGVHPMPNW
jgi:hypothetical protein